MVATRKGLKVTNIGASKTVKALMIRVTHSNAPTITVTAKQDMKLPCKTINTKTRAVVADAPTPVPAGTILVLVASEELPGWYYIGRVGNTVACTCPGGQFRHTCDHQPAIEAAHKRVQERAHKQVATEFTQAVAQLEERVFLDGEDDGLNWTKKDAPTLSPELLINMPEIPTNVTDIPNDEEYVREEAKAQAWVCEELSIAEQLKTATTEECRQIWKRIQKDERIQKKELALAYWTRVHAYHDAQAAS